MVRNRETEIPDYLQTTKQQTLIAWDREENGEAGKSFEKFLRSNSRKKTKFYL